MENTFSSTPIKNGNAARKGSGGDESENNHLKPSMKENLGVQSTSIISNNSGHSSGPTPQ
jgi:hypothetical protein